MLRLILASSKLNFVIPYMHVHGDHEDTLGTLKFPDFLYHSFPCYGYPCHAYVKLTLDISLTAELSNSLTFPGFQPSAHADVKAIHITNYKYTITATFTAYSTRSIHQRCSKYCIISISYILYNISDIK